MYANQIQNQRCEITGCHNNSVGDSSGTYYCKEHLEPMREKHARARKITSEVVGKFLQGEMEAQQQSKIKSKRMKIYSRRTKKKWQQQQISLSDFNPALVSTYDRKYLEHMVTYFYQENLRLSSAGEVARLEEERNEARIQGLKLRDEVESLREAIEV